MSGEPPLADLLPTPMAAGACPAEEAAAITSRSGTSFAAGMAILPKARREGMRAVYAFCRVVDDIADGDFPIDKKHSALDAWRAEIDALYAGGGESVVAQALRPCITAFDLPKEELLLMIEGMAMDVDGPIVAPTEAELDAYIRRVAGTVGLMSMRVFCAWIGQPSHDFALALARALQTTNILRDVEEDADLGRLYLPRERLSAHAMPVDDPRAAAQHPKLPELRRELGAVARGHYDEARRLAPIHDRRALRPALLMMGAYEGYLDRLEAADWAPGPEGVKLGKFSKLARGLRYGWFGPGRASEAANA